MSMTILTLRDIKWHLLTIQNVNNYSLFIYFVFLPDGDRKKDGSHINMQVSSLPYSMTSPSSGEGIFISIFSYCILAVFLSFEHFGNWWFTAKSVFLFYAQFYACKRETTKVNTALFLILVAPINQWKYMSGVVWCIASKTTVTCTINLIFYNCAFNCYWVTASWSLLEQAYVCINHFARCFKAETVFMEKDLPTRIICNCHKKKLMWHLGISCPILNLCIWSRWSDRKLFDMCGTACRGFLDYLL